MARAQKKARREGRLIAFIDETEVSTRPHRVRTGAPAARPPVIRETFGWKSLSIIGAITQWRTLFRIHPGSIKGPEVVAFFTSLARHTRQPLLVIWDGAPIHCSRLVMDYIASTGGKIVVEHLPAYAPEVNPAEYIWAHLKRTRSKTCWLKGRGNSRIPRQPPGGKCRANRGSSGMLRPGKPVA